MSTTSRHRIAGAAFVLLGLGLGWWGMIEPLNQARAGVPTVAYDTKIFALVPTCIVCGLFFLLGSDKWPYRDAEHGKLTRAGWVLVGLIGVAAIVAYVWFDAQFKALGYGAG